MEFPESFIYAGPAFSAPEQPVPAPYFRRQFRLERVPEQAELLICGIGFYELYVNGQRITRGRLAPYISSPDVAVYYDSYDITPLLKIGENVLGVWLGNGFQNNPGGYVWDFDKARFRGAPRFALRLDECSGEKRQAILESDKAFLTAPSPLLSDDYRVGETYDARKERPDWLLPGTPSGEWKPALCAERPRGERVLRTIEPVTIEKELRPVSIRKVDDGYLYDFGENNAGVCRLHVTAEAGQTITMHHGEHLIDGKLDLTNLTCDRTTGSQKDVYICKAGENVYTPTFTYHGFQYVWIRGLRPEQATEDALTYLVMHTQLPVRGGFRCSDETVNRIHEASMRSTLSNFVHFPTDCPQREKNGWTADAALSAEHTLLYFAPERCYHEWLRNIRGSQAPDGSLPGIVPTAGWGFAWGNGPAWDCVLFWLPYALMQYRNDLDAVWKNAHAMLRYLDYLTTKIRPDGLVAFGLGDWCPAGRGCGDYLAPLELTDSIMAMDICRKAAEMFRRIGRQKQSAFAAELADAFRQSIRSNLINWETMLVKDNCQTSQAMALYFHVFEETECAQAFARLMEIIETDGERMNVGVLGGRVLFHVLSAYGQSALALHMITRPDFPSYGNWIARGATTLWEEFQPERDEVTSLNHHFWGNVSSWFMQTLAGIRCFSAQNPDKVCIQPFFPDDMTFAEGWHQTPQGRVFVRWERADAQICLHIEVPTGARGWIVLEDGYKFADTGTTKRLLESGSFFAKDH